MSDRLSHRLHEVEPYPNGVMAVQEQVSGTAFFPSGSGLWSPSSGSVLAPGGILFLANDLGSISDPEQVRQRGADDLQAPVWRNLLQLLDQVEVDLEQCFFTCYYMGIRTAVPGHGNFPGNRDSGFTERCGRYLMYQLALLRPRAIFTLGSYVPGLLAPWSLDLRHWIGLRGLTRIDAHSNPLVLRAHFPEAGITTNVAALTHTSMHNVDVHRRSYRGTQGHSAEVLLMLDALKATH